MAAPRFTAHTKLLASQLNTVSDEVDTKASKATLSLNVRDFGATGDGVTDDTTAIQAGINAACLVNGELFFPDGLYLTGPLTIGVTGSYNSCNLRGERMHSQYADTTPAVGKGTIIKLKAAGNNHLFTIPPANASDVGPGPPLFADMWLDGNASNQTGSFFLVELPSHTATVNKARSAFFENVRGSNASGGIRVGQNRNAGRMSGVAILGTTAQAVLMGSCSDWRMTDCDFWSTGANCWYSTGGGSVFFTMCNFFSTSSTHGVKIDATAGDHTFYGCSFDRNGRAGIYVLGSATDKDPVTLIGCRFTLNGRLTTNTYSDVMCDGGSRVQLVGCTFQRGSVTERPKYCVETLNSASNIIVSSCFIKQDASAQEPFGTAFTNDTSKVIMLGDEITAKNFWIDYDPLAVNRARVKGATSGNSVIFGANGEANVGVNVYAESTGDLTIGRTTNKLAFYGASPARSKQTVTGSKGANAALTSLLTALANLGLITDSSS